MSAHIEQPKYERAYPLHLPTQHHLQGMDVVTTAVDETEEVRNHQPTPTPRLTVKEVGGQQYIEVGPSKLPPSHGFFPFRGGWNIVAFEDIADRLVTDRVTQVFQGTLNTIVAPRAVLVGHTDYQIFDFLVHTGTAYRLWWLRGLNLVIRELTVPGEHGIRLGHGGDFGQRFLAQLGAQLSEFLTLAVGELHAAVDLLEQDAILCQQIFVTELEMVVQRL
jgi:hypothetical protein